MIRPPTGPTPAVNSASLDFACVLAAACRTGGSPVHESRLNRLYFIDTPSRRLAAVTGGPFTSPALPKDARPTS